MKWKLEKGTTQLTHFIVEEYEFWKYIKYCTVQVEKNYTKYKVQDM